MGLEDRDVQTKPTSTAQALAVVAIYLLPSSAVLGRVALTEGVSLGDCESLPACVSVSDEGQPRLGPVRFSAR